MHKIVSRLTTAGLVLASAIMALAPLTAQAAASTVTVYPGHLQGWSSTSPIADTKTGGAINFIADATSPLPNGALQLTTDATGAAKAQLLHVTSTSITQITELSYSTKQNPPTPSGGDASYQLPMYLNGTTGFTTLVYEPYQNGTVTPGIWQTWNVATGLFWSTRTVVCSGGTVTGSTGGPAAYTLAQIKTLCPQATVIEFGVNIGSNNPSYNVETDAFDFNGTTYNFEAATPIVTTPTITSPANNSTLTTSQWTKVTWTPATTSGNGPITYQYQATSDSSYTTPIYTSGPLTASEIQTPGTPAGVYYIRVQAKDADGNLSAWSNDATNPYKVTVNNSPTTVQQCLFNGYASFTGPASVSQSACINFVTVQLRTRIINSFTWPTPAGWNAMITGWINDAIRFTF